jgi:hypothetical protein
VIKFVSDLRQVSSFLQVHQYSSTNKTDRHDITELLLKVALNTITLNQSKNYTMVICFIICLQKDKVVRHRQLSSLDVFLETAKQHLNVLMEDNKQDTSKLDGEKKDET